MAGTDSLSQLNNGLTEDFYDIEKASLAAVGDYIKGGGGSKEQTQSARLALGMLGLIQRRRTLELARDKFYFYMARSLTTDPHKLAAYIQVTQPSSPFTKALLLSAAADEKVAKSAARTKEGG